MEPTTDFNIMIWKIWKNLLNEYRLWLKSFPLRTGHIISIWSWWGSYSLWEKYGLPIFCLCSRRSRGEPIARAVWDWLKDYLFQRERLREVQTWYKSFPITYNHWLEIQNWIIIAPKQHKYLRETWDVVKLIPNKLSNITYSISIKKIARIRDVLNRLTNKLFSIIYNINIKKIYTNLIIAMHFLLFIIGIFLLKTELHTTTDYAYTAIMLREPKERFMSNLFLWYFLSLCRIPVSLIAYHGYLFYYLHIYIHVYFWRYSPKTLLVYYLFLYFCLELTNSLLKFLLTFDCYQPSIYPEYFDACSKVLDAEIEYDAKYKKTTVSIWERIWELILKIIFNF